jgi:hypothetical protein
MSGQRPTLDPPALSGPEAKPVLAQPALRAAADEVPRVVGRLGPRFAREEARLRTHA